MRDEMASLVDPILTYGLQLKERLQAGEMPDFSQEQANLIGLLRAPAGQRSDDYQGEAFPAEQSVGGRTPADGTRVGQRFLGCRYALASWLDDIFVDSPWRDEWREHALENTLFHSRERAWLFWDQAKRAEGRPGGDALEVFFLCVVLGFRGDLRDDPEKLQKWVSDTKLKVGRGQGKDWPAPPEIEPTTYVPPRAGRERLRRMTLIFTIGMLLLIPVVIFIGRELAK